MADRNEQDGLVPDQRRQGDVLAIKDLAVSYAHAIDDRDWARFEALWVPDAHIDYLSSGGIEGNPADVAAWMPEALSAFSWTMHSVFAHEIRFTGPDSATGRSHLFNRNGVVWEGEEELFDVSGLYLDDYVRVGDRWKFRRREEKTLAMEGGAFAAVVRDLASRSSG